MIIRVRMATSDEGGDIPQFPQRRQFKRPLWLRDVHEPECEAELSSLARETLAKMPLFHGGKIR
jgi:hypothetical protein